MFIWSQIMISLIALQLLHNILAFASFIKQWIFRIPGLSFKKPNVLTVESDARQLKKLPLHLGMIFQEDELSYTDIANAILWAVAMGISYISVYDVYGNLKRNEQTLYDAVESRKTLHLDTEHQKAEINLHSGLENKILCKTSSCISVVLLSLEDGRESIVQTAQTICKRVAQKHLSPADITTQSIENFIQDKTGYCDPDCIIRFGPIDSLLGFMPWHVRLTEIICSYQCYYYEFNGQDRDCFFHPFEEHLDKVLKLKNQELSRKTGKLGYSVISDI